MIKIYNEVIGNGDIKLMYVEAILMTSSQAIQTSDQVSPGSLSFFDMCLSTVQNFILFSGSEIYLR